MKHYSQRIKDIEDRIDERLARINKKMEDYINDPYSEKLENFFWKKKQTAWFKRCLSTNKLIWPLTDAFYGINKYGFGAEWISSDAMVFEKLKNPGIEIYGHS